MSRDAESKILRGTIFYADQALSPGRGILARMHDYFRRLTVDRENGYRPRLTKDLLGWLFVA